MHEKYKYTPKEQMARISWFSAEAMLFLMICMLVAYLFIHKCQDCDSSNRIPTRREEIIAENSIVLDAHDLELRKMEYIKRKRGQKYPPTNLDGLETLPQTPIDQSFVPQEEQMSVSDSSQGHGPQAQDFVFPTHGNKNFGKNI